MHDSPALTLTLLGPQQLARGGDHVVLRSRKHLALLMYLAVEQQHRSSRDTLLNLLWPDANEEAARNNLRVALADLRRLLGEADVPFLQTTRHTVQFDGVSNHTLDVTTFRALLGACRNHAHATLETCAACLPRLEQAVALYGGDFLHGFVLPDSAPFEEWLLVQRAQLHQAALETLETLVSAAERQGDHAAQCRYARRQIELEPWREGAHVQLMRGLWMRGQCGAALEQYAACVHILREELGIEPDAATTALYEAIKQGHGQTSVNQLEATPLPPTALAAPIRVDTIALQVPSPLPVRPLPVLPTSLLGRGAELAQLASLLADSTCRLLTLVGAGGIGKTSLALQAAREVVEHFADGVYFVNLAPLSDPELVAPTLAQALGVREAAGQPLLESLQLDLRDKQVLVLLDNFEQVLSAAPLVAELVATCPSLKVLVTSRALLNVRGEQEIEVPPLAVPPLGQPVSGAELLQYPAVALFVERARAANPRFVLTDAHAPTITAICRRLDGLPLAIELAGARIKVLSPQALLARLEHCLAVLIGGARDLPKRQQTLRSTIAWSYDLLTRDLQTLFVRLAVFSSSWTLEAAEAVCTVPSPAEMEVLEGVTQLVNQSLLRREEQADGEVRFSMPGTIQEYALERLAASGAAEAVRRRHAAYYLVLAEQAEPQLQGVEQAAQLKQLEVEHDNLRAALGWALERNPELGICFVATLWRFWYVRCYYGEGCTWLEAALARGSGPPAARAKALVGAGMLAWVRGDTERALALGEEGLVLARAVGDRHISTTALIVVGFCSGLHGDEVRETALLEESLALARELSDTWCAALSLGRLGFLAGIRGEPERAEMLLEESLILAREVGDKRSIALSLNSLGHLPSRILGVAQPHETRSLYEESLTLFREVGDTANIAATLLGMGLAAQRHGDHVVARVSLEESVHLARAVGARELTAALNSLGLELMYQHDLAQALTVGAEGLALCREQSDLGGVATALLVLGLVAYHQGDYAVARAHLEESVACWQESGSDKDGLGWALNSLGRVVLAQGEARLACRLHQESLALRQEVSNSLGMIECMEGLAEVTMAQGQTTRAARLWGIAETLRDTFGASLPPIDRAHYARTIAAMRAALGEEQWAAVRAAGRAISLKQAMTEALEQLSEWPGPTIKQGPKEVLLQPRGQDNGQP